MILYFLRHGQAGDRAEWQGDDAERPLTKRGKESMGREAETIVQLDLRLEVILTSPLLRAVQTGEIIAERLMLSDKFIVDPRLAPGFNFDRLVEILKENTGLNAILLVGHEPDFSQVISQLTEGGQLALKKGGLARVDLNGNSEAPVGVLVWLIPPKVLIL
jgi:phosphohistidine phosphatase